VIPISRPDIGPAEEEAVLEVLRSGMLAMGKRTAAFEEAWAAYCGVRHAILMTNGTVALEAILHALGIGPGDEVITVSFSFNATVSAILRVGATPVFVDIRADDFCIDPALVEAAITPRTKAILPVHLYGLMADMDPLVEIAARHGLRIVEDAAQAHGATYGGKRAGRFGAAMFSLYATKNLMRVRVASRRPTTTRWPIACASSATTAFGSATTMTRWARTSSPPTSPPRSGSPSWAGSMSGPNSAAGTPPTSPIISKRSGRRASRPAASTSGTST
jgi:hypothetical protein